MADVRYIVEFKSVDELSNSVESNPSDQTERRKILSKEPQQSEETTAKNGSFNKKAFAKFVAVYGAYQIVNDIQNKVQTTQSMARGDNLKATMQSEQNSVRDKYISAGLGIVGGFVVAGPIGGGLMVAKELYSGIREAINLGIQNQYRINQINAQRHVANNEQERFVRTATTERIRQW